LIALNAAFGWAWITLGFLSGMLMGLRFYREDWLGGYDSWRRRLVRLGHIATIALGVLNVLFALTARYVPLANWELQTVSIAFVIGGATMPIVCALAAWRQNLRHLFVIPVASLLTAGITLTAGILKHGVTPA
jgi:hypothetical protein